MQFDFLIADYVVRVTEGALCDLMLGFEHGSEERSASEAWIQEPICAVRRSVMPAQHGVERIAVEHPMSHVLTMGLDGSALLAANDSFSELTVRGKNSDLLSELMLVGIYSRLAQYRTILVHASLVDIPEVGGLLFVGASGVGKTTQAVLWEEIRGATIINGDKVFLGLREDCPGEVMAYGSPWKGNSPYCVNRRVPLRAIVVLERRAEKYIRRLSDLEVLISYVPRVFMPGWDPRLTEMVMDTLDGMLPLVPVYEMSCNPDASAVYMVEETVFGGREAGR